MDSIFGGNNAKDNMAASQPPPTQQAPNINIIDNARQMINPGSPTPPISVNYGMGGPPPPFPMPPIPPTGPVMDMPP